MNAEEKRRRFHDALLRMLYPPTLPKEDNQNSAYTLTEGSNLDQLIQFPDESKWERGSASSSSADGDEDEGACEGPTKLTRAQRKRLRKKKLKEAASRRRKLIGPTLPGWEDDGLAEANGDVAENGPPGVRQNADYAPDIGAENPETEAAPSSSNRKKQKCRRMAKKLASESLKSSSTAEKGCSISKNECRGL